MQRTHPIFRIATVFLFTLFSVSGAGAQQHREQAFLRHLNNLLSRSSAHHGAHEGERLKIDTPYTLRNGMLSVSLRYETDTSRTRYRYVAPLATVRRISSDRYLILEYAEREVQMFTAHGNEPFPAQPQQISMLHLGNPGDQNELADSVSYNLSLLLNNKKIARYLFYYDDYLDENNFADGMKSVERGGKYGFVNKSREVVIPYFYEEVNEFSEGLAAVKKGGRWGFIDTTGKVVIPIRFEDVTDFSEGQSLVRDAKTRKQHYIDRQGRKVKP